MAAARETGISLPSLAEQFGRDHATVIHAVRRAADRPRLADATARVTEHINSRHDARLPRQQAQQQAGQQESPDTYQPNGQVEHAVAAAAAAYDTTAAKILSEDRTRPTTDARAVAMSAARRHGHSLPAIAKTFDVHHTTVLAATRRVDRTPPLRDLAGKIAAQLPTEQPAGDEQASTRDTAEPVDIRPSPGARAQQRDPAMARPETSRHLRVAR